jgi:hypothetical protein
MEDIRNIFDAAIAYGKIINYAHKKSEKLDQINSVKKRKCGNCSYWMTARCAPERKHGRFKSCDSIGCGLFHWNWHSRFLFNEFTTELMIIDQKAPMENNWRHMWE